MIFAAHVLSYFVYFHKVGVHSDLDHWPECIIPTTANTAFAGYVPTTDESLEVRFRQFVPIATFVV